MTKLLVRWGYRGAPSGERYIPAGEYDSEDEKLLGLWQYLVQNGHAEIIDEDEPVELPTDAPDYPDPGSFTVSELEAWLEESTPPPAIAGLMWSDEIDGKNRGGARSLLEEYMNAG
jgi:hypothetical protein